MRHNLVAALAVVLALFGANCRAATFDLSIDGAGTRWYYYGVPGCDQDPGSGCTFGFADFTWTGTVEVTAASGADGVYGYGAGLQALDYTAPGLDSFTYVAGDQPHTIYGQFGGGEYLAGLMPGASVTITNGHISSLTGSFVWDGSGSLDFTSGLQASNRHGGQEGQPGADTWWSSGALSEFRATLDVPEPETFLMLAVGLGALAIRKRRA